MPSILIPSRYNQQPQQTAPLDRGNALGAKVIEHISLRGASTTATGALVTYGPGGSTISGIKGRALRGTGSVSRASVPLDLTRYSAITIAFWLYWDSYANDDALAMELGGTYSNNSGFIIDPNCSSPAAFMFGAGGSAAAAGSNLATFPRPSAGAWHRIALVIDRASAAGVPGAAYVDGVAQAMSPFPGATTTSGNFGADAVHLLSRSESSLFGAGNLQDVTFYRGALSPTEVAQDFANPWQIFRAPPRRLWFGAASSTPVSGSIAWTEGADTASITGLLTNRTAAAWVEDSETVTVAGVITDRGALAWTEQGDTHAITVAAASPPMAVAAALAWTEAGDSASLVSRLTNRAALALTEQGDTWALTGYAEQPPAIKLTVRFDVLRRDFRTKITHFSN